MKKYKTLILLLILCMIVCIFAGTSYAWFVKVKRTGAVYFKTGEVEYSIDSAGFDDKFVDKKNIIVPGDDLIKKDEYVYFINNSSISSSVRILLKVVIAGTPYIVGEEDNGIIYRMMSKANSYQWEFIDGYWYYKNYDADAEGENKYLEFIPPVSTDSTGDEIAVIESIILDGSVFGNSIEAGKITIEIYFQAKQADYASWESIGKISATLGE